MESCVCQEFLPLRPLYPELAAGLFFGCALYRIFLRELLGKNENLSRFEDALLLPMLELLNIEQR